ncbi:MAG: heme ABC exporter ATP-binding protein CcmA, partial [Gammaproteobacteria bacterium]
EEGEILWDGTPVASDLTAFRASLAFLGHAPGIKLDLSARENLEFSNALGINAPARSIDEALNEVGLVKSADLLCRYLSEGQRRRVAIARLYLSAARLWILDEPLAAIDQSGIETFFDRLETHLSEGGLAVVTSHQPLALRHHITNTLALGQAR